MIRKQFLVSATTLAALQGTSASAAIPGGTQLVERSADFDAAGFERTFGRPAGIKQLFEAVGFHVQFLNNVKNSLNGLQFGFGYAPHDIGIAACPHGPSSVYVLNDASWAKYRLGEAFNITDASNVRMTTNGFLTSPSTISPTDDPDNPTGFYQDTAIETLQRRGTIFLACHTALEEQARTLVKRGFAPAGMSATDVADDLLSTLVPGALVVPAMVSAIAVLQRRYGYAYTTIAM